MGKKPKPLPAVEPAAAPAPKFNIGDWFGGQTLLVKLAVSVAALSALCTTAWSIGDYTKIRPVILNEFQTAFDQTQQNTAAILSIEFGLLDQQFRNGILDDYSKRRRCELAYQLRYFSIDGCDFSTFRPLEPLGGQQ